jgi:hypothetical protein
MMTLETESDAAFQEEVDCHLREKGLCVYCMTPWQPSATYGWDDRGVLTPDDRGVLTMCDRDEAARRHLYQARGVNLEWAEDRFERKLKKRVLDVRWVGDMFWRWARKKERVCGGRFNYLYWIGDDTRWNSERAISGCLLGNEIGLAEPGGRGSTDFDISLSVRARDGMYERGEHSGIAVCDPSQDDKREAWRHASSEGLARHRLHHQDWWLPGHGRVRPCTGESEDTHYVWRQFDATSDARR